MKSHHAAVNRRKRQLSLAITHFDFLCLRQFLADILQMSKLCTSGGELVSTGSSKWRWRAVVDQQATLKADHKNLLANHELALAA